MKNNKKSSWINKKKRIRKKIFGTEKIPRLTIYRSSKHIYAQIIDDIKGVTLVASSTLDKENQKEIDKAGNCKAAKIIGEDIGKKALKKGIQKVVFDRNGFVYHGRVKSLASGARGNGLQF